MLDATVSDPTRWAITGEEGAAMTTLDDVAKTQVSSPAEQRASVDLVARLGREQGLSLTVPDGLLEPPTETALGTALNEETTEHLGYEKHDLASVEDGQFMTSYARFGSATRQRRCHSSTERTVD
jgi:hypothetical protein